MNAYELLDLLNRSSIAIEVDGDRLRFRASRGRLSPDLVAALRQHKAELIAILTGGGDRVPLDRRPDPGAPVPLSFAQRQLWFLDQLAPGNPVYHNPVAIDLTGPVDPEVLARALTEVVRRHETLRTTFDARDGEPMQRVHPPRPVALPIVDLRGQPAAEIERATAAAADEPFDLSTGPLLRARLLHCADERYRLLLTVHHIVADGWSIGILLREFAALVGGQSLPEPPVQYADYVLWQRRRLDDGELERQLGYWTGQLAGAPDLLALPTDRPRPAVQRFAGQSTVTTVDAAVAGGLHAVSRAGQTTLFSTLAAALSVLLWRYTGQGDICLGTPFANRSHRDVEGLIGHFINTVVLRTRIDPARPFAQLRDEVRDTVLAAQASPDLPFERLVEALHPQRSPSHSPLFQVMLVLQNLPRGGFELPGLAVAPVDTGTATAKFDLSVEVTELPGGELSVRFEYDTDLFDDTTIDRFARHFDALLAGIAGHPDLPVRELPLLDPAERDDLVYGRNATARPPVHPLGIAHRFSAQARRRPEQTAVVAGTDRLDYATLDRRSGRLAQALVEHGVRPGHTVGLRCGLTTDLLVGIFGILKAGAAYLPLDPALPRERLAAMVADAAPVLVLDGEGISAFEAATEREPVGVHPESLAYVIYTSGSAGRPKGVAVPHGAIANLLDDWVTAMGSLPGEPAALWSSIGFDVSVHEILLPLTTGGTLHLVPEKYRDDPAELLHWLREHRIAQAYLPPAYVRWLAEAPTDRLAGLALRQLLVGVEPLPEADLHRLTGALPGLRIRNGYGPTETTVYSTAYPDPRPLRRTCPIGTPLANTRVYVLDERLEPVPVGVTGEVYVGGAGLARGYLGRPAASAVAFLPDPFVPGERMYRTGDLARILPDGPLEFLGRRDKQVKVRGYRVELGEVEAALLALPGVREAAVVVGTAPTGEARLVAGVCRTTESAPRPLAEWRDALSARLPGYMVPSLVVELDRLPQTGNGKLDRDALLRAAESHAPAAVNQSTPRDQIELTLYELWTRLLLHPNIGIGDSFFDVGGTSISAIKLAHAINDAFGVPLPVRDIMLYPTIEALGARLRRGTDGRPPSNLIEFRAGTGRQRVVCVHPAGGTAFCYLTLAQAMPEECGVWGIQSPGVNPGEDFLPTVEAMAESYLAQIAPQGDGPLVLTGLSYGGLVAYEMGRRLALAGHTDISVLLLDTLGTDDPEMRAAIEPVDLAEFRDKLVRFNGMYPGIDDRQIAQYHRIYNHNRSTMRDYLAPPSPARLVLLQATAGRGADFLDEIRTFWGRRANSDGLTVEELHRDHWEILESDAVHRVARLVQTELDRLDARTCTS
ncbi:amino acid adenylation domain-containing protein [Krasilnikovia cinnamomea]|uniref:Amino acid adenylation domain-containing protein n=1 Tax=Krasilnikovia cinnamomea TaxID=349313 RepID=A0A4Q7ZQE8_9ACTN|nr:non-ribosomal peptide synthetase [Krasilnikovia cinnamomea]RZU53338.1 amino acid adenylation domain-containing protein [Krasilnikovia cinnamomea]